MNSTQISCINDFFRQIDGVYKYAVMRNADELPFENHSNDIDILIDRSSYREFEKLMQGIFRMHGFGRVERTSFHGIECYTFFNLAGQKPFSLKIDLFFNIEGGGVLYYTFDKIITYRVKNSNGVYVFGKDVESFITAVKTLSAGGCLKEKYLDDFLKNDFDSDHELYRACPSSKLREYMHEIRVSRKNPSFISRRKIIVETLMQNIRYGCIGAVRRFFYHYKLELGRCFSNNGFVVFVGPDGAGKTSLIERLKNDSRDIFRSPVSRFSINHHRPHLLKNISDLFKKTISEKEVENRINIPHSGRRSGSLVSFFKLVYYAVDYSVGFAIKIYPLRRANSYLIFDRYYYDFIVDQERSAINLSKKICLVIYLFFIPKPCAVFFIRVEPAVAHSRKAELSVGAIRKINTRYEELSTEVKGFVVIDNHDFEKAYEKLLSSYIKAISIAF